MSSTHRREALALEETMDAEYDLLCSRMTIQRKALKDSAKEAKEGRLQMVRAVKCIERMLPIQNLHQLNNPETKDHQGAVVSEQVLAAITDARPHDLWKLILRKQEENNDQLQRNMRARRVPQGQNDIRTYQTKFLKEMERNTWASTVRHVPPKPDGGSTRNLHRVLWRP